MLSVLERYRELGSNLAASIQVRKECEEAADKHWHRLHEKCWCGHLGVPSKFYEYDEKGRQTNTQVEAEAAYLTDLKSDRELGQTEKSDAPMEKPDREVGRVCECGCGAIIGHLSPQARFSSEACRKRAYRARVMFV